MFPIRVCLVRLLANLPDAVYDFPLSGCSDRGLIEVEMNLVARSLISWV